MNFNAWHSSPRYSPWSEEVRILSAVVQYNYRRFSEYCLKIILCPLESSLRIFLAVVGVTWSLGLAVSIGYIFHPPDDRCSKISTTDSLSIYMTTFSASLTKLLALLPQSRGSCNHVSRWILAAPPPWLQKHTDLRAHDTRWSSWLRQWVTAALRYKLENHGFDSRLYHWNFSLTWSCRPYYGPRGYIYMHQI
jgi:hypothetical protein